MLVHCISVFRVFGGYFCIWFFCKVTIILSNKFSNNHRYLATEISSFQLLKVFAVLVWILIHMPGSCCLEDILPSFLCPFCFLVVVLSEWNITAFIILPFLCFPTATSRQNRLNGRISIHAVGNLTTADGFPSNGWKSIHWMEIQPGPGLNSNHLSPNTWMEIQPSLKQNQAYKLTNVLWPPKGP